ncbi:hypothetical protein D9756_004984 [Leucocoprinus leucothites]|uniref:Uncharacterized protein n=1 Tax=Leucocoprinus leucothites TaxID=201217 RepID=A0A8H5LKU0_9AGAR|nr:hypothetical protein D9756_004984 [Leucoagaricus leucothites]
MTSLTNSSTVLNPDTYLNHLTPSEGRQFELGRNIILVALGMTIWDILVYVPEDWRILRRNPLRCIVLSFIFSRLFALSYVLLSVLERTMPFQAPRTPSMTKSFFGVFSYCCSTFLFLRRLHAVYSDQRWVRWIFSLLWIAYVAVEFSVPFGVGTIHIPGTRYYRSTVTKRNVGANGILLLIYDTSVFLAITIKVVTSHSSTDERVKWSTIVSGKALPRLSRAIIQGGQQYYLMTAAATILVTAMVYIPTISGPLKLTFTIPVMPFVASMASRAYRNLRLYELDLAATSKETPATMTNVQSECTNATLSVGGIYNC